MDLSSIKKKLEEGKYKDPWGVSIEVDLYLFFSSFYCYVYIFYSFGFLYEFFLTL